MGGRYGHRSRHCLFDWQNGEWHCRQYADYDLPFDEGARVCGTRDGLGYVCASLYATKFGPPPFLWQSYHRTRFGRVGLSPRR